MSNEKNMQRKWDREEVIILVTADCQGSCQ